MGTEMNVQLIARTQLDANFLMYISPEFCDIIDELQKEGKVLSDGEVISLTAIRTCYSYLRPSNIFKEEGKKYFLTKSKTGDGSEKDRLFNLIFKSGHTSTLEHINFTFAIEGVSRALLAQLTRHRINSYSVQSQRYVPFGTKNRSGGFEYITPDSIEDNEDALRLFDNAMIWIQDMYDELRAKGINQEDARAILPNAASVNLVFTANLASLLNFYSKRKAGKGAQGEIAELAEYLRLKVVEVEPWTDVFFKEV